MARTLVLERSSHSPCAALFDGETRIFFHAWDGNPARSPGWLPELADVLASHRVELASIARFVCGLGPGSFSGIRATLAAIQGMALPGRTHVQGIASPAILAWAYAVTRQDTVDQTVTVVGDARRNRYWCVTYRINPAQKRIRLYDGSMPTQTAHDFSLIPADALETAIPSDTTIISPEEETVFPMIEPLRTQNPNWRLAAFPSLSLDTLGTLIGGPEGELIVRDEPSPIYLHPAVATPPPFPAR